MTLNQLLLRVLAQEYPRWFDIALRVTGQPEHATEVLQTCAVRLGTVRRKYLAARALRPYIAQTVYHTAVSFVTAKRQARSKMKRLSSQEAAIPDYGRTPLEALLRKEDEQHKEKLTETVLTALEQLPQSQRRAVEGFYLRTESVSLTGLARAERIPISTIRSCIRSGLQKIRKQVLDAVAPKPGGMARPVL